MTAVLTSEQPTKETQTNRHSSARTTSPAATIASPASSEDTLRQETNFNGDQVPHDNQSTRVSVEPTSDSSQCDSDINTRNAAVGSPRDSHLEDGAHSGIAVAGNSSDEGQHTRGVHRASALVGPDRSGSTARSWSGPIEPSLFDPFLALAADIVDDLERTRIANENRLRTLTRSEADSDGQTRGFGMDERDPDVARTAALVQMLADTEHQAILNLNRALRKHPLGPWIKNQKGVGEKTAARLLAVVGDPYANAQTGEIRTVSQLWSYCGHGDPSRRKFKGMTQEDLFALGNPTAKKRVYLIATCCLKAQAYYADVYYARKEVTEGREHATDCVRCGPSGKPALAGSPWSDAHRHADALRIVGKEFLRDLWLEAKRLHEGGDR